MAEKLLTPTEIKSKKRTQSKISQTTGALGLGALGSFAASKAPGAKVLTKTPMLRRIGASRTLNRINPKKAENLSLGLSTASAGIGGVGSFNFAQYTRAEADKGKRVKKNDDPSPFEDGFYGTTTEIKKSWSPTSREYSPEKSREKRTKVYERGADVGAGVAGAVAAQQGARAAGSLREMRQPKYKQAHTVPTSTVVRALKQGGRSAAAAGVAGGALVGGKKINEKRKGSWAPVAKSAFGVAHD